MFHMAYCVDRVNVLKVGKSTQKMAIGHNFALGKHCD